MGRTSTEAHWDAFNPPRHTWLGPPSALISAAWDTALLADVRCPDHPTER